MLNPDPEKFILTKWGDVTVLGKRKQISQEIIDEANKEIFPVGDGIQVTVNEEEDLDFVDDVDLSKYSPHRQELSSDEDVLLGGTADNL